MAEKGQTIEENFPKIRKQNLKDISMLDCAIDVEDKEMPIEVEEVESELSRFFHLDKHLVCVKLINHFVEFLGK
jgi:hypothetical protein